MSISKSYTIDGFFIHAGLVQINKFNLNFEDRITNTGLKSAMKALAVDTQMRPASRNDKTPAVSCAANYKLYLLVLLFFLPLFSYSTPIQDSIRSILTMESTDSVKISRFGELARASTTSNSEKTEVIFAMMEFSEDITSIHDLARCYYGISLIYYNLQYYDNSLEYGLKSARAYEHTNNRQWMANIYNLIGNTYQAKGDLTGDTICMNKSIEYHLKNIELRKELLDTVWLYNSYINISFTYAAKKDYDKAIEHAIIPHEYFLQLEKGNEHALGLTSLSLGDAYLGKARVSGNKQFYKTALSYYDYPLTQYKVNPRDPGYILATQKAGEIYYELGQPGRGLGYLMEAHELFKLINDKAGISSTALLLARIYDEKNDAEKSSGYLWTHLAYKDSLINEKARINVEQMDAIYKASQKEKEIQALQNDKEKQAALMEAGNKKRNIIIFSAITGLVLVLVFLIFILNRFKVTRRQKRVIEIQKAAVDANQKKIVDSINYAKKIQYSILPPMEEIEQFFPGSFVFFQPKDIVSGDFYWFHHENEHSFFAAVDCTGHGVPGAFMTMIAHSILIEVVIEQKVKAPEKILANLHQQVFKSLQQQKGDEYAQDGMDISLAVIDHKNKLIHFAGARNHAFLVEGSEVKTLKATPKSIGGLSLLGETEPTREFNSETVSFSKNSILVLSTDGYFDQLNRSDEKFGMARFKQMITGISGDVNGLKVAAEVFRNWKGTAGQLDDVLLVGIRL